ncbi:hypothetical protein ACFSBZ_16945 [Amnibacterium flavum]|uniref:Uncharacterized protein n=1 Tax=Amnibacterium flavum TaxID=2173173 RepID=A0A2V1HKP3_9MICO|nr:hypothetical protein [Amnibacterium flavum]PVZ93183.1 hypothetical protein DDQ50_16805 [Amnibacterium flavum]
MGWKSAVGIAAAVALLAGSAVLLSTAAPAEASCSATGGSVDVAAAGLHPAVAGYSGDQLANAAAIMNAAAGMGLTTQAQVIGVMTAMGESGLRALDYGDTAGPDSRGLFQQRTSWGSLADRMDPTKSAQLFYARLVKVEGWENMTPTAAAHAVQINADPDHYTRWAAPAAEVVQALSGSSAAGCSVGADAQVLAQQLVTAADNGQLRGLVPDHIKEIRWIAQGKQVPDCGIDVRVLQVMVIAVQNFEDVGVSDINRKCTGQLLGAGATSSHNVDGGGKAVDFYRLNGTALTGADTQSVRLITMLEPVMPKGSRVGQIDCRADRGTTIATTNFTQFEDSCNHLHLDVAYAGDAGLRVQ